MVEDTSRRFEAYEIYEVALKNPASEVKILHGLRN